MHVCCGPCAAAPLLYNLCNGVAPLPPEIGWQGYEITGLFYNPNIHPESEQKKRREGAEQAFGIAGRPLMIRSGYMQGEWESFDKANEIYGNDEKKRLRCEMCYRTRLAYTASLAKASGFDAFSTSLLISPYQDHEKIKTISIEQSIIHKISFLYIDWRPYFRESQKVAREAGLYRQKYCGCIFSM